MNNSSYSMSDLGTSPATETQQIGIAVGIAILGAWSTFGNFITLLAITTQRGMLTKCNLFILSLAVSDLLSGCIASPLWLYRRTWGFYDWGWGQFLCHLFWFTDESTSYCTSLHIASFAVWRLLGVKCPIKTITIWLTLLWTLSVIFGGFVFSSFYDATRKLGSGKVWSSWPMCSIRLADNGVEKQKAYYTFSQTTFMVLPLLVLLTSSSLLVNELYSRKQIKSRQRRNKEKKASMQLALIASSFLFGYIPMTTYVMWTTRQKNKTPLLDYWFHVGAYFALRLSECVNPIVYNIASSNMRKASMAVILRVITFGRGKLQTVNHSLTTPRVATPSGSRPISSPHRVTSLTRSLVLRHNKEEEIFNVDILSADSAKL